MAKVQNIERVTAAYASASDFCRIFAEDMSKLYLLAFLLTADEEKAERCFAGALEDCSQSSRVFREWAHSWARRAVIQNAIRLAGRELEQPHGDSRPNSVASQSVVPEELSRVIWLNTFERFLYVMSVLERYTDQDCAVLLRCRRQQVVDGRLRALQHLATSEEKTIIRRGFAIPRLIAETA